MTAVVERKRIICGVPYTVRDGEFAAIPYPARIMRIARNMEIIKKLASLRFYEVGGWFL